MSNGSYDDDLERGLANRRALLGDAWVERSLGNANSFNAEFQHLITRFAWHEIWSRPGLDAKTRRIIVLAICCALGRWEEFELHLRTSLADGIGQLTPDEIKEVLLQCAVYAGVPAANTAFAHAIKLLRDAGVELPPADVLQAVHPGVGRLASTASAPRIHYAVREPKAAPKHTIVLSHALGCDLSMWDALANALAAEHRVIAYDQRGHGRSAAPASPYTMADLADDAERLLAEIDAGPVVWIGLSMGGMVGQELALRHPQRVKALVIANSTGRYPAEAKTVWQQRIDTVRRGGLAAIADMVMGRYFTDAFRAGQPVTVARFRRRLLATDADAYIGCCQAVMEVDTLERLAQLKLPALVIAGELDQGTPVAMSQALAQQLRAELLVLPGAAHLSSAEQPEEFARAVDGFVARLD